MNEGKGVGARPRHEEGINSKELICEMTNKIEKLMTRLIKKEKISIIKTEKHILTDTVISKS